MADTVKKTAEDGKLSPEADLAGRQLRLAAIGLEAEFALIMNGVQVRPEDVFGDPRAFIRGTPMHRTGTSYHLPTGGAVYFDTGVIELATPVIEIERGCAARAGRSLWEGICFIRSELDAWEQRAGSSARLAGFSTHYNISFELPAWQQGVDRTVQKLALLLAYILPVPVMLLAANRQSTGVGVRPRGRRIEVTADFTPSSSLMIATATSITGIVREVMTWPSFDLSVLERKRLPRIRGFRPIKHTSRQGWLARFTCYPQNPFAVDVNAPLWEVVRPADVQTAHDGTHVSLREIAAAIIRRFWRPIARMADPFTFRLIASVMRGTSLSMLDLPERPGGYEDVGRLCRWEQLFSDGVMARSRYERVLIRAISGEKIRLGGLVYTPVGMRGWSHVIFRREADNARQIFSIDYLLGHLADWERG